MMEEQIEIRTNSRNGFWNFLSGALAGVLTGAVVMMLFAPHSGKRTRARIQQKSIELKERINNTVEDALTDTRHKAHQIKVKLDHQTKTLQKRGQAVVDDQKEHLSTLVEAGKTAIEGIVR